MAIYREDGKTYYYKSDLPSVRAEKARKARERRQRAKAEKEAKLRRPERRVETPPESRVVRNIDVDVRFPAVVNQYRTELIIARTRENGTIVFRTRNEGEVLTLDIDDLTEGLMLLREEIVVVSDDAKPSVFTGGNPVGQLAP